MLGFDLALIRTDVMHACFVGLFQATSGSIIWELLILDHFAPAGSNMKIKLGSAFGAWRSYLRMNKFRIDARELTLSMLGNPQKDDNWADLNGKAHDCRMCVGWLAEETQRVSDVTTPYGRMRAALAWTTQAFSRALEEAPRYLDDSQASHIHKLGYQFLALYCGLHRINAASGTKVYHMLRKTHTFAHLLDDVLVEKLNPRHFSAWTDETFLHHVVQMCSGKELDGLPAAALLGWCTQAVARWQSEFV